MHARPIIFIFSHFYWNSMIILMINSCEENADTIWMGKIVSSIVGLPPDSFLTEIWKLSLENCVNNKIFCFPWVLYCDDGARHTFHTIFMWLANVEWRFVASSCMIICSIHWLWIQISKFLKFTCSWKPFNCATKSNNN